MKGDSPIDGKHLRRIVASNKPVLGDSKSITESLQEYASDAAKHGEGEGHVVYRNAVLEVGANDGVLSMAAFSLTPKPVTSHDRCSARILYSSLPLSCRLCVT